MRFFYGSCKILLYRKSEARTSQKPARTYTRVSPTCIVLSPHPSLVYVLQLSAKLVLGKALYEYVASGTDDEQSEGPPKCKEKRMFDAVRESSGTSWSRVPDTSVCMYV